MRGVQRLCGRAQHRTGLEHEGHGVGDDVRPRQVGLRGLVEGGRVRAVPAHAVVQRRAARGEAVGLGIVDAVHQAHELAGHVAVEPRRPEGVLRHQPARRENREIHVGGAGRVAGRGQHGEDAGIGMVETDRADGIEAAQVVFVRGVVAVPGDHVQRRMPDRRAPQMALELGDQCELAFVFLVGGDRREEIAWVGQAVGADRPQVGQPQQAAEVLAHVAARGAVGQFHAEAHAARDHRDFLRRHFQRAQFGAQAQLPELRDQQQFRIGVVEEPALHRRVGRIQVHRHAMLPLGRAVAGHGVQAVDEVHRRLRQRQRAPAQLVRRHLTALEVVVERAGTVVSDEAAVHHRRADAIQPTAPVDATRRGERGTRQLLGVQAVGHALRRVLPDRQRAGHRLGGEFVAEAGHVAMMVMHMLEPWISSPSPTGRGVGVRVRRPSGVANHLDHGIDRKQYVIVPEAHDPPALRCQPTRSCGIAWFGMLRAVDFDNQLCRHTTEICDIRWDRVLTPELGTLQLSASQITP
ncbi:hypothetical protein NB706_001822 [Xanthomonas sacchari]|nr:hypothetical protein [Xanthomonas sacchari]